ncbi:trypsin alpha-3-like [Mercenaria mercenaria]|uniref:trypsin alpha-3-like n=1 Tax=Mercenaria mercenaria TaxID=6596 RepID=UPI00234E8805|nr:trypsin alpha-3-like [Mercenaria mercenaria]
MQALELGIDIDGQKVAILLYANDAVLLSENEGELQLCLMFSKDVARTQNCGQSGFDPTPRLAQSYIVGGSNANEGDFPWQVGLIENGYLICGGTYVLGNDGTVKVITAAHCLSSKRPRPSDYRVVFGMHVTTVAGSRRILTASSIKVHSGYNSNTMANDIAVIGFGSVTPDSVDIASTWAAPACLASRAHYDNEDSVVSGWGTTSEGGSSSDTLKYVWKPLMSRSACEATGNGGHLDDTMLCAGEAGKDACQGDSGGPLVVYRNGAWELTGVVSWGFGCGQPNYPGVYADVWYFRTWLATNL